MGSGLEYVIATLIEESGETDTLFVEEVPCDDGCVALTQPMDLIAAYDLIEVMRAERANDY